MMDLITGTLIYFVAFWIGALSSMISESIEDKAFRIFLVTVLWMHGVTTIILFAMLIVKGVLL